jgi:hypothetical protein
MPSRKTDLVRRSLFGGGEISGAESARAPTQRSSQRRSRSAVAASRGEVVDPGVAREPRRQVERTAVTVPSDLLMRVKDAVAVLNGWPHQYTMARFVEEAFTAQLERLKREHNDGREFPVTNRKIRTGRPPGT